MSFFNLMNSRSELAKKITSSNNLHTCSRGNHKQLGKVALRNNQWGSYKLKKNNTIKLCMYYNNKNQYAWQWQIPKNARGVIAYPSIAIGRLPWGGGSKKVNSFPIRIDSIKKLNVEYSTEVYVKHKKYNLSFDLWLTNIPYSTGKNITHEIMIWEDYFSFTPYGKKIEVIQTPFGEYSVFIGDMKKSEINLNWKYMAFVRSSKRTAGAVNIKYLLNYLRNKKIISTNLYLSSVEFGNEVGNSSGFTFVKKFELNLIEN